MVADILNLRTSPKSSNASLPDPAAARNGDEAPGAASGGDTALAEQILEGLRKKELVVPGETSEDKEWAYAKEITTMVLYDDKGLDIYDRITQTDDYYLYGSELAILQKYGKEIAGRLFASTKLPGCCTTNIDNVPAMGCSSDVSSDNSSVSTPKSSPRLEETEQGEDDAPRKEDSYRGLQKKTDVKEKWGDSAVGRNNFGVNGNLGLDEQHKQSYGSVIELGAGSLKKTSVLLRALHDTLLVPDDTAAETKKPQTKLSGLTYYALDLEHGQLETTLAQLEKTTGEAVTTQGINRSETSPVPASGSPKIVAKGICASYDDALPYLKEGKYDSSGSSSRNDPKSILFLGSSIGNYSRSGASDFLRKISEDAMLPGDTMLIGIDGCDDCVTIERAYNDSLNVTRDFILNGIDHVDAILGHPGFSQDQFEYANRYNQPKGRHEAYLRAKEDFAVKVRGGEEIKFARGELVRIERSYKYTPHEAAALLASAGLRVVQKWTDDERTGGYSLYLVEKPLFWFPSTLEAKAKGVNPFGLPSLQEWDALWKAWDCVTLSMIPRDLLLTKPIDLRHICLFYLGHIPGFLDIHMSRYLKEPFTEPAHYPDMFERGIDPNMEDPSKVHAHSVVPTRMEDWPSVDEIVQYRDRVRKRLHSIYTERLVHPKTTDRRLARVMGMVYEHEVMHLETLLYMAAQITPGKLLTAPGFTVPDWPALSKQWDRQVAAEKRSARDDLVISYSASRITIGHDDDDALDAFTAYDAAHTFGWDNETPSRVVDVPAFKISQLPISNGEYLAFYRKAGMPKELLPGSWLQREDGSVGVRVLTAPGVVPIEIARDWPCMAAAKQLSQYAESVGGRLPREGELRRWHADHPVDHVGANIGFANWHPTPARLPAPTRDTGVAAHASNGGVWEWTCSTFDAHEGWKASELYPDYSRDFFDGCHWIMLGGSFATIPRVAGRTTFTNWYQAGYPYVFAGGRVAYDA